MSFKYIKIGNYTYYPKSKCMCPKDWKYTLIPLTIILVPSGICFYFIFNTANINKSEFFTLTIVYAISLITILWFWFKTTFTDPGIIPKIPPIMQVDGDYRIDSQDFYFVEYLTFEELEL